MRNWLFGAAMAVLATGFSQAQDLEQLSFEFLSSYETGVFDGSAAEIAAFDPSTNRLFVVNGDASGVDVLDISDVSNPTKLFTITLQSGGPNSVAIQNGWLAIAVDEGTANGSVDFYRTDLADGDAPITRIEVGSLPDMVAFTNDGTRVLSANEGEPGDTENPEGSVSIITVGNTDGSGFSVATADFTAFNGREAEYRNKGVRIFEGVSFAADMEPEYIAITPDDAVAVVTLQEANAVAIVDIASATIVDVVPLGLKDHSISQPILETFTFNEPDLAPGVAFGGLSGLHYIGSPSEGVWEFATVPDRGPNGDPTAAINVASGEGVTLRPFLLPDYQAKVYHFTYTAATGQIMITKEVPLTRADGTTPISGLPNLPGVDEVPAVPVDAANVTFDYSDTLAFTSFEEPATGGQYTDTGDANLAHDLVNNPGEASVDFVSVGGEMGFDARYVPFATPDVGLTDGDFVGVTNFTGAVGSYTDGTQGYQISDPDGTMVVEFDTIDISGHSNVEVSLDVFIASTGWEDADSLIIYVVVDGIRQDILIGDEPYLESNEGSWMTLRKNISGNEAYLVIEGTSNASSEAFYFDNVNFIKAEVNGADYFTTDEMFYDSLDYDAFGADLEGIVVNPADDTYWMVDEYRPSIYHFDASGTLLDRFVPEGTAALVGGTAGDFGTETLPAEYVNRRANRGFEGMALDTDNGILYAFIQTPLNNPDRAAGDASKVIRMLGINPADGSVVAEYVYLLDKPWDTNVDKIGDAVYDPSRQVFYVMERDSRQDATAKKFIFEVDLTGATNLRAANAPAPKAGLTLEQHTPADLEEIGVQPVYKRKILNLPSLGYLPSDKPEGLTLVPGGMAVLNDNDFGLVAGAEAVELGIINITNPFLSNGLDASDRDGTINIRNWPVLGMYMPDAIAAYVAEDGNPYFITANEGDDRGEDERIKDVLLDPNAFPNAQQLQEDYRLGRLGISTVDGDLDGDGDHDRLYSYGSRSFTIWDAAGNLVWDSHDLLEQITAELFPDEFNSNNDENDSFESRSDNKGPEPEGVAIAMFAGRPHALVGLERIGGVMVFDVSDPTNPVFVEYFNNRDFEGDAAAGTAGDLGPEGLLFIPAEESPNGQDLLVVTNEVSGNTSFFSADRLIAQEFNTSFEMLPAIDLQFAGSFETGLGEENAEISAWNKDNQSLYVMNSSAATVTKVSLSDPANPQATGVEVDITNFGAAINSVATYGQYVAVAVEPATKTNNGFVVFLDTADLSFQFQVTVGALPDMITFNNAGTHVIVANEGEPNDDYTIDPEGSVSVIDVANQSVSNISFAKFNALEDSLKTQGVRIFGPGASVAQDLEPEFIQVSDDDAIGYVMCQENNALVLVDLTADTAITVLPLGYKDWSMTEYGFDASNRDGGINLQPWPVFGMYQPDAMDLFTVNGKSYIITANEGDAREYEGSPGYVGEARIKDITLDPTAFPDADFLQEDEMLGRLKIALSEGDIDGDGDYDELYAYGARSFSVWDAATGALVYDSEDGIEVMSAALVPDFFNSQEGDSDEFDDRSDDKGAEPEGVVAGEIEGRMYAFVGFERQGGILVADVTNPSNTVFVEYESENLETQVGPEGMLFIPASESPNGQPLLVVSNEISSNVSVYTVTVNNQGPAPAAPSNLTAEAVSNSAIELAWDGNNNGDRQTGFVVWRGENGAAPEPYATLSFYTEEFVDEDVMPGNSYEYLVQAQKGALFSAASNSATDAIGFFMHIVHNNDAESQLVNAGSGLLENYGGAARYRTVVNSLKDFAEEEANGIVVLTSGDNFLAGPEFDASFSRLGEEPMLDAVAIDLIGYDALTLGNHDFDFGPDVLEQFIKDVSMTEPTFLSANLDFRNEPGLRDLEDEGRIAPYTVIETQGQQIGVIGLTTTALASISSPRNTIVNTDLATIVNNAVTELQSMGVDKIILSSHLQGLGEDRALASNLSGVDIIIAGGGGELLANPDDRLIPGDEARVTDTYPTTGADADGNTVYFVTTRGDYRYAGHLYFEFDEAGAVKGISDLSGPIVVDGRFVEDQEMLDRVIAPVRNHIDLLAEDIIADNQVPLDGRRGNIRSIETNLGNLCADAILWSANEKAAEFGLAPADVAIQNGGGIRNDNVIPEGPFSALETFNILPFGNLVAIAKNISPAQFKELMENSFARIRSTETSGTGRFAQISGFAVEYDSTGTAQVVDSETKEVTSAGSRVWRITLISANGDSTLIIDKGEVAPGAPNVNMAVADFTVRGGDDYPFAGIEFDILGVSYQQALYDYVQARNIVGGLEGVISAADYPAGGEGRIIHKDPNEVTGLDALNANSLMVYPNPATEEIRLILSRDLEGRQMAVQFLNILGQEVEVPALSEQTFDVSRLEKGVYIIKLTSGNQQIEQRFIKE